MDYIERTGSVEELIETVAGLLETRLNNMQFDDTESVMPKKEFEFLYNDIRFKVCEYYVNYIGMITPNVVIEIEIQGNIDVGKRYVRADWEQGYKGSSEADNRRRACNKVSRTFVMEVLPKVDLNIKKELYNEEIDRILSELD